jgi:hypothetical protein
MLEFQQSFFLGQCFHISSMLCFSCVMAPNELPGCSSLQCFEGFAQALYCASNATCLSRCCRAERRVRVKPFHQTGLQGYMSISSDNEETCSGISTNSPSLFSHPVEVIKLTPGTDERCANATSSDVCERSIEPATSIHSHQLLSITQPCPSPNQPVSPLLPGELSPSTCTSLPDLPVLRPDSPGVSHHLQARAARCASPSSLRIADYSPTGRDNNATTITHPSLGLRALVGTVHATSRKEQNAAVVTCSVADKLLLSDVKSVPSRSKNFSPKPPLHKPPSHHGHSTSDGGTYNSSGSEQPNALRATLNRARLHVDPAAALIRQKSCDRMRPRRSLPALLHLAQSDLAAGAHGDALRSSSSFSRLKPARARRNTRVRALTTAPSKR